MEKGLKTVGDSLKVSLKVLLLSAAIMAVFFASPEPPEAIAAGPVSFGKSLLQGSTSNNPTSLQFGPDGRLYVASQLGVIKAYTVARNGANDYSVTNTETINNIKSIPNHNDDGTLNPNQTSRQVTGLVVTGTAANPVLYVSSSDPRIGGGADGSGDINLDTNSGMISRLDQNTSSWVRTDLVRGLPRSEENHAPNGMQLSADGNTLYVSVGGNTNHGAPSTNFAELPEYALAAAILEIDLQAIGDTTYDLPTLNDEDQAGSPDATDPFGGNDGKNQARIVPGGPVQVYASGFRNAYDVLIAESGKMYTIDNSGNAGWGDVPVNEGPAGNCTNQKNEPGTTDKDTLHLVSGQGYYGGHPNPTRANTANTFNATIPQSPVPDAEENPVECDYRAPGAGPGEKGSLASFDASTNGIDEYTASTFGGAMQGELLAAGFDNAIYRVQLNATGNAVVNKESLGSTLSGNPPLDVTAQGDAGPFPGTIWATDIYTDTIVAFEPNENTTCNTADDPSLDSDEDGFDNADEIDNGTNPCSSADAPPDYDNDTTSNLNDPDDDNDTQPDTSDPFAVDANNGKSTNLPVNYTWDNDAPSPGGLLNLGFTGLMTNKTSNYESLYDPGNMTAGGAAGATTIDKISAGDAFKTGNTQEYGLQFGVNATSTTGVFTAHTQINAPFAGITPQNSQAMGLFLGNGDQDNYVKLTTHANNGVGGIQFAKEVGGAFSTRRDATEPMPGPDAVDLYLTVNPSANTVQPSYSVSDNGVVGPRQNLGGTTSVPAGWFGGTNGLAVGIISTSSGPGPEFAATWDSIEVVPGGGVGDTTAPVAQAPSQSLNANFTVNGSTSAARAKVQWSATDSGGSGVESYELQQSINGGAWADVALPTAKATSILLYLTDGNTYRFRVRARDQAGNVGGWEAGQSFKVSAFQDSSNAIGYVGTWNTQSLTSAYGKSLKYASAAGATASSTFNNALSFAWIAPRAADRGNAEVRVDGALTGTTDLYSSALQPRKAVFVQNDLNPAVAHTLEVRVLGTKNAASTGTRVDVDAFVLLEEVPN